VVAERPREEGMEREKARAGFKNQATRLCYVTLVVLILSDP
jgi:hypothetical protein